jgi:hypothetical protein
MNQVHGITGGDSGEKEKEKESEFSYYDGDMDRPWEDEKEKGKARDEEEDDPDYNRKFLLLTPANLGCMPPADDDISEPTRGTGAGAAPASNMKTRGQGQYWEEGEQGREKEKQKENPRLEEAATATAEGDVHYVRQSTNSVAFLGESSQGARRAASGLHAPSGAEGSLDTGYLRQQHGTGYGHADPHPEEFCTSNPLRDLSKGPRGAGAGAALAVDSNQMLNYESAGYNQKSTFEGTNSMILAHDSRVSSPLPERQATSKQSTHGY